MKTMRSLACYNCDGEGSNNPTCSLLDEGKCPYADQVEYADKELEEERRSTEEML